MHRLTCRSCTVAILAALVACAGDESTAPPAAKPPAAVAVFAGNAQLEAEGIAVSIPPAVRITDADANPVHGVSVTFVVASGGGSVAGAVATTNASGVAAAASWTLGTEGENRLSATVTGSTLDSAVFIATALRLPVASVTVTSPSASLVVGDSVALVATPRDSVGRPLAGRIVTWESAHDTTLTVASNGMAKGLLPGTAEVSASSEGLVGELELTVHAPTLTQESNGLTGHLSASTNLRQPQPGFEYGFSWYSSVHSLGDTPPAGTQLGWGSWIIPNNEQFSEPLCPVGTYARDNWPERGPTWRDVYQTIEGGMGRWSSSRFPSNYPKFRVNSVPDCYDTQIASSGWTFGGTHLSSAKLGLAQLSNRLLVPPDGLTFDGVGTQSFVGNGWLALPLIGAGTSPGGLATGDQSWTLFLRSTNFAGPVAFLTPETYTAVHASDATGLGRGLDARPGFIGGVAMEIGITPMFTSTDSAGIRYRRVPRLDFAADANDEAIILQDVRYYSKQAIWDAVAAWLNDGPPATALNEAGAFAPSIENPHFGTTLGGDAVTPDPRFNPGIITTPSGPAFGLRWTGGMPSGVFAEYFRETGDSWTPVDPSEVPRETWLVDQTFDVAATGSFPDLNTSASSDWDSADWAAGPSTASLNDGSLVTYVWYRFVDQPAIARLGLSAEKLSKLQEMVEELHAAYGTQGATIPTLSQGTLVAMDAGLLVQPPAGLEVGYVPVVIRQR